MKLNEQTTDTTPLRVFETWYETETVNGADRPIIYCKCRDMDREPWLVEVEGFAPHFHIPVSELSESTLSALKGSARVQSVTEGETLVMPYNRRDSTDTDSDPSSFARQETVRVETNVPYDIPKLRENFDLTGEADVRYPQRFMVDMGVYSGIAVPSIARSERISSEAITTLDNHTVTRIRPRICYYDIEVETSDSGPSVVSEKGSEQARNPITAIAMADNYTDETLVFVLADDSWTQSDVPNSEDVRLYTDETAMLEQFCTELRDRRPDVLTGWNSGGFDDPYFINRCLKTDVTAVQSISPTKNVSRMNGDGRWRNSDLRGIILFDLLDGYKNISRRELDSFSLGNVAASEDIADKLDVDEQQAYVDNPQQFIEYVRRDCTILKALNEKREII